MPQANIGGSGSSVDVFVDMGHPFLNRTVDGFLKVGAVGVTKAGLQEAFSCLNKGSVSKNDLEATVKTMGTEGLRWGVAAGVFAGMEYGMHETRGKTDWMNSALGGALTGAILSLSEKNSTENVISSAITGGAIATAADLLTKLV